MLQPLVENAVNHGLELKQGGGHIAIRARSEAQQWVISIEDNGVGIPPEKIRRVLEPGFGSGLGMGLTNVNQRLRSLYGPGHGLEITSLPGRGTRVTVRIPWHGQTSNQ